MSDELKYIFWHLFDEGWNKGNTDAMVQLCTNEFIHHRPPFPDIIGVEAEKADISNTFKAFSEIRFVIHEILIDENTVGMRWSWYAKHTGESPDLLIIPTGKQVAMEGCSLFHVIHEKIIEEWEFADYIGYFTQLGVIPPLG